MNGRSLLVFGVYLCALAFLFCIGTDSTAVTVRVVKTAVATRSTGFYDPNRAPLEPTAFMRLPVGSIKPEGWLRNQLDLDANGIPGRYDEVSDYIDNFSKNGWVDPSQWGWEELPYWLRGYGDLGYVLGDQRIIQNARKWIDGILSTQQPDGYFGPAQLKTSLDGGPDLWPHMLVLNVMRSWYEYSGDKRVIPFLTKYFQYENTLPPDVFKRGWGAVRWGDNLDVVYWLYNRTGYPWLLDLGDKIQKYSANYTTDIPTWHNVNLSQGIREPAEYWLQGKNPLYLKATENDYDRIMQLYGQFSGGGFAGDENCRPGYNDPRQGLETCGFAELMHTFEIMTHISGNPIWADRCENIAFNSLPATESPDHRGVHYITPANIIEIDTKGKMHNQFANGSMPMLAYEPGVHSYRCCPHNVGMAWPYFAENLWLATADRGLCASMYSASVVTAKVGEGTDVKIIEETEYPFNDGIRFKIESSRPVSFPIYLRIPEWCKNATIAVNGKRVKSNPPPLSYAILENTWRNGDVVDLKLPMRVWVKEWKLNKNSVSVNYGPLTFSLDIKEKWVKAGGSDTWPIWDVYPESSWNYGLNLNRKNPAKGIKVIEEKGSLSAQPFTPDTVPIKLIAPARLIPNWKADSDDVITTLQQSPIRSTEAIQMVTLIPMGAARLRITSFPQVTDSPDANEWQANPVEPDVTFSHANNGENPSSVVMPGPDPSKSYDPTLPRCTWWDHMGTQEWAQWTFEKPRMVKSVAVYWYDDTGVGGCRVPKSWELQYKDGNEWKPVEDSSGFGVALNRYNRVTFSPVKTSALRIVVQLQPGFSGGLLRWKVNE